MWPSPRRVEFEIETVVNFDGAGEVRGNFSDDNGFPDNFIPGFTGNLVENLDDLAVEILYYVELPAGITTFGVNSNDGFETVAGRLGDVFWPPPVADAFYGTRGSSDSRFPVFAEEAGVYAFRTVWFERGGGSNIELFTFKDNGSKVLLNAAGGLKTYRAASVGGRAFARKVLPKPGSIAETTLPSGSN